MTFATEIMDATPDGFMVRGSSHIDGKPHVDAELVFANVKHLLGGVELVADRSSKEVLPNNLVVGVKDRLHEDGMLITVSGPHKNVLRLQPPLCITAAELDRFVSSLKRSLDATRAAA